MCVDRALNAPFRQSAMNLEPALSAGLVCRRKSVDKPLRHCGSERVQSQDKVEREAVSAGVLRGSGLESARSMSGGSRLEAGNIVNKP